MLSRLSYYQNDFWKIPNLSLNYHYLFHHFYNVSNFLQELNNLIHLRSINLYNSIVLFQTYGFSLGRSFLFVRFQTILSKFTFDEWISGTNFYQNFVLIFHTQTSLLEEIYFSLYSLKNCHMHLKLLGILFEDLSQQKYIFFMICLQMNNYFQFVILANL